jgi:hypothetical protein
LSRNLLLLIAGAFLLTSLGWIPNDIPQAPSLPSYSRTLQLEPTSDTSANVSIGDVNGDRKLDLVLIKGRHWPGRSRVLLGDGRGNFSTAYDLTDTSYRSYSGNLVDLDGNGSLDVVLSNDAPDPKVVLLNDGKGHFRLAGSVGKGEWPTRNAAVVDLNGDRRPDVVLANRGANAPQYFCVNQGGGHFDACTAFADYSATTITPADINADGKVDLVVPNRDGGQSYTYLNRGDGSFAKERRVAFGPAKASIRIAAAADFDRDGSIDIVVSDDQRRVIEIYYGDKSGGFGAGVTVSAGEAIPYALLVADLDRNGRPDIIVGYVEAPSSVFFGDGGQRQFTRVTFGDNKGAVYGFAVADLDGDGNLDIAAARSEAPNMLYFGEAPKRR